MKAAAWTFTAAHAVMMLVGLFGILIAIPHSERFAGNGAAAAVYVFALTKTGGVSIFAGAIAMFAYGWWALGARRALIFLAASTIVSALAELTGTKTGWPFGGYAYAEFLGWKMFGLVPLAIPFSWFTLGFASFVLANAIVLRARLRRRTLWSIVLGAWLLTAWDLVLDPAMAAPQLQAVHFWTWHEAGPYFGMPLRNLAGWMATGVCFIGLSRALWREPPPPAPIAIPLVVYGVNLGWAIVLVLAAGLWPAAVVSAAAALAPLVLVRREPYPPHAMLGPRAMAWWALRTTTAHVEVHGLEHVPSEGPVILAARHVHHLLDGAVLLAYVPRPVHILVALDWTANRLQRRWMERACGAVRWPVILRPRTAGSGGGYATGETARYLLSGLRDAAELLREGRLITVFPEGYPLVDPAANGDAPPRDAAGFAAFAAGFRRLARLAECRGARHVAIVPVGFAYRRRGRRWEITARFGPPFASEAPPGAVEHAVRELSRA